mmetsp:Transcript_36051/g.73523  ORF Transcript_36051/g.73523 Transcript_36051/m.73523 type:complete len:81 (+) Transcript_36051:36-278(+)
MTPSAISSIQLQLLCRTAEAEVTLYTTLLSSLLTQVMEKLCQDCPDWRTCYMQSIILCITIICKSCRNIKCIDHFVALGG